MQYERKGFRSVGGRLIEICPERELKMGLLVKHFRETLSSLEDDVIEELYQLRVVEGVDESFTAGVPNQPRHPDAMAGD